MSLDNMSWCRWKQDPALYKHVYLPYGKDLNGEELKMLLASLMAFLQVSFRCHGGEAFAY